MNKFGLFISNKIFEKSVFAKPNDKIREDAYSVIFIAVPI
jgi:hypothetical protein